MKDTKEVASIPDSDYLDTPLPRLIERRSLGDDAKLIITELLYDTVLELTIDQMHHFTDEESCALADAMINNTGLRSVSIWRGSLSTRGAVCLGNALQLNRGVTSVSLDGTVIDQQGCMALGTALSQNPLIGYCKLSNADLNDECAQTIAMGANHSVSLRVLDLTGNDIFASGTISIASAIQHNQGIHTLNLGDNVIQDEGLMAIADVLNRTNGLKELIMYGSGNAITPKGFSYLMLSLHQNTGLRYLYAGSFNPGLEGAFAMSEMLKVNRGLVDIDISGSGESYRLNNQGAQLIADGLTHNRKVTKLDIAGHDITGDGFLAFIRLMEDNPTLIYLTTIAKDLSYNISLAYEKLFDNNFALTYTDAYIDNTTIRQSISELFLRNQAYPSFKSNSIRVGRSQTVVLTRDDLDITSPETLPNVMVTVANVTHGRFVNDKNQTVTQFEMADIDSGIIGFEADDSDIEPTYGLSASNGKYATGSRIGVVIYETVPEPPVVTNKAIPIAQNQTEATVNRDQLDVSDGKTDPEDIIYIIKKVVNGVFQDQNDQQVITFTQADIDLGNVQFIWDGRGEPYFEYEVRIGGETLGPFVNHLRFETTTLTTVPQTPTSTTAMDSGSTMSSTITDISQAMTSTTITGLITRSTHTMWQRPNSSSTLTTLAGSSSGMLSTTTTLSTTNSNGEDAHEALTDYMISTAILAALLGAGIVVVALYMFYKFTRVRDEACSTSENTPKSDTHEDTDLAGAARGLFSQNNQHDIPLNDLVSNDNGGNGLAAYDRLDRNKQKPDHPSTHTASTAHNPMYMLHAAEGDQYDNRPPAEDGAYSTYS